MSAARLPVPPRSAQGGGLAAGLILVLLGSLLAGCGGAEDPQTQATAPPPTSVRQLSEAGVTAVARVPFCDLIAPAEVRRAINGGATNAVSWGAGDPIPGQAAGEVSGDVGCSWSRPGSSARAWVFARPVDTAEASTLASATAQGCSTSKAPGFGEPSALTLCRGSSATTLRRSGHFTDSWLTCELTGKRDGLKQRLDRWCATVAYALRTD